MTETELWSASSVLARIIFPLTAFKVSRQLADAGDVTIESALVAFNSALEQMVKRQPTVATIATLTKVLI